MTDILQYMFHDGSLTAKEVVALRKTCRELNESPVRVLRSLNIAKPEEIQVYIQRTYRIAMVTDKLIELLDESFKALIPIDIAIHYGVFAVAETETAIHVAMEDPSDKGVVHRLEFFLEKKIIPVAANVYQIASALMRLYEVNIEQIKLTTILESSRGIVGGAKLKMHNQEEIEHKEDNISEDDKISDLTTRAVPTLEESTGMDTLALTEEASSLDTLNSLKTPSGLDEAAESLGMETLDGIEDSAGLGNLDASIDSMGLDALNTDSETTELNSLDSEIKATELDALSSEINAVGLDDLDSKIENVELDALTPEIDGIGLDALDSETQDAGLEAIEADIGTAEIDPLDSETETVGLDMLDSEIETVGLDMLDSETETVGLGVLDSETETVGLEVLDSETETLELDVLKSETKNVGLDVLESESEPAVSDKDSSNENPPEPEIPNGLKESELLQSNLPSLDSMTKIANVALLDLNVDDMVFFDLSESSDDEPEKIEATIESRKAPPDPELLARIHSAVNAVLVKLAMATKLSVATDLLNQKINPLGISISIGLKGDFQIAAGNLIYDGNLQDLSRITEPTFDPLIPALKRLAKFIL